MGLWLKKDGEFIPVSGGSGGDGPHDHDDYLPLAGGTLTGDLEVNGKLDVGTDFSVEGINVEAGYLRTLDGLPGFPSHSFASDILTGFFLAWPGTIGMDGDLHIYGNTPFKLSATKDTGRYYSRMQAGTGASIVLYSPYDSVNPGDALVECETLKVDGDLQVDGGTEMRSNGRSVRVFTGGTGNVAQIGFTSVGSENPAYGILSGYEVWIQTGTATDGLTTQLRVGRGGSIFDGDLTVNGTINGTLAFGIADGIDTAEVLDRAETAAMPVLDDEGAATTDAESITVNEVVTALLAKVKEQSEQIAALSADIQELKGN